LTLALPVGTIRGWMTRLVPVVLALLALMPAVAPAARTERAVPFAVGETLRYDVSWSSYITAGTVTTTIKDKRPSFNATAYYIVAEGRTTPLLSALYPVYYKIDSLLDSVTLLSQRGSVYTEEGARHRLKTTRFDRAAQKVAFEYTSGTTVKREFTVRPLTQDALSALYVLRTLPLKAGGTVTLPVSDDGINDRVQFAAGGVDTVRTPMGQSTARRVEIRVFDDKNQPVGKNLAVWLSEDPRRLPVKLTADLPVGRFELLLRSREAQ
jgi:hypothetical protein